MAKSWKKNYLNDYEDDYESRKKEQDIAKREKRKQRNSNSSDVTDSTNKYEDHYWDEEDV